MNPEQQAPAVSIVLATWCPHCVPLSLENIKKMSVDLGIPYRVLDIDHEDQCKIADELVRDYGDECCGLLDTTGIF